MNRHSCASWLVLGLLLLTGAPLAASSPGAPKVFTDQLLDLHSKVKGLLARAEQRGRADEQKAALREEVLAMTSLVHRLSEEASKANLALIQNGRQDDHALLLVSQASEALSFTLIALGNFIDTEDSLFLSLARDGEALARSSE